MEHALLCFARLRGCGHDVWHVVFARTVGCNILTHWKLAHIGSRDLGCCFLLLKPCDRTPSTSAPIVDVFLSFLSPQTLTHKWHTHTHHPWSSYSLYCSSRSDLCILFQFHPRQSSVDIMLTLFFVEGHYTSCSSKFSASARITMVRLQLHYRGLTYRPNVIASRVAAATAELTWLLGLLPLHREHLLHGQFARISEALEVVFSQPEDSEDVIRVPLVCSYRSRHAQVSVLLRLYFHATVSLELFLSQPALREERLSEAEWRQQFKQLIFYGSPSMPAIFAYNTVWSVPASVPRPVHEFDVCVVLIQRSRFIAEKACSKAIFQRLWKAMVASLCASCPVPSVTCRRFARTWTLRPSRATCLKAFLSVQDLLHADPDIETFRTSWESLVTEFCARDVVEVLPHQLFSTDDPHAQNSKAVRAPRPYTSDTAGITPTPPGNTQQPGFRGIFWCQLCDWHSDDADAWSEHMEGSHSGQCLRQLHLAMEGERWPAAMRRYSQCFWDNMSSTRAVCASCALPSSIVAVGDVDLRSPPFDTAILHACLSADVYVERHASLYPDDLPGHFVGLPLDVVASSGVPAPHPHQCTSRAWVLHLSAGARDRWRVQACDVTSPLHCPLCDDCAVALASGRILPRSLANGNLCLGFPPSLQDLTFAECVFIARGFTLRRLKTLPARAAPQNRQRGLAGNTISFPQNSAQVFDVLPRPLAEASDLLTVLFPAADLLDVERTRSFVVRQSKVRAALQWLQAHNPFYADIEIAEEVLQTFPEGEVPTEFLLGTDTDEALQVEVGPSDAQAGPATSQGSQLPVAAAVLDVEGEGIPPLHLWQGALPRQPASAFDVVVPHGNEPLSSFDVSYWSLCFPHLFPYGDGAPTSPRAVYLPQRKWARHLLLRADRSGECFAWALDLDFIAVLFSNLHRQAVFGAVEAKVSAPSFSRHLQPFQHLAHTDFASVAAVLSTAGGVSQALSFSFALPRLYFYFFGLCRIARYLLLCFRCLFMLSNR